MQIYRPLHAGGFSKMSISILLVKYYEAIKWAMHHDDASEIMHKALGTRDKALGTKDKALDTKH